MKSSFSRAVLAAALALGAVVAGAPAAHADGGVSLRVTLSGTTPEASASADPAAASGLVAGVTGYVDGVRIDATECAVHTSDPAAFASGLASASIGGCTGSDIAVDVGAGTGSGAVSLRLAGPGPGSCVMFCRWVFDVMSASWVLDCPWAARF